MITFGAFFTGWYNGHETLIQTALMSSLLAFSFQVALRSGVFTFGGVGCWAIGAYITAILVQHHWSPILAIAAAVLASGLVGLVLALILGRLRALYLAMATVAFSLLIQIIATTLKVTGQANGLYDIPTYVTTLGVFLIVAACGLLLHFRERGASRRQLETIRLDERLAPTLGVNLLKQRIIAFVLSSMLAAMSGAVYSLMFSALNPAQAGFSLIVTTLTMVVIGGTSSWFGSVIGAFIITWIPSVFTSLGNLWPAAQGGLVVLAVIFAPDGIVGIARSLKRLVTHAGAAPPDLAESGGHEIAATPSAMSSPALPLRTEVENS